jgi:hypothetical protein
VFDVAASSGEKSGALPRWLAIVGAIVAIAVALAPAVVGAIRDVGEVPEIKATVVRHQDAIVEMRTDIKWIARRLGKKD